MRLCLRYALSFATCLIATAASAQPAAPAAPPVAAPTPAEPAAAVAIAGPSSPPGPAALREAKRRSALGAKLFGEQVYEAAVPDLLAAYTLAGQLGDLRKLARSYVEMGEFDRAYEAYERMLSAHAKELGRRDLAATKTTLGELELKTALVTVKSSQDGASVANADRPLGTTPLAKPIRVTARTQKISVTKEGYEVWQTEVTLAPQQQVDLDVKMETKVLTGHLAVREQKNSPAHVLVDGVDKGPAPWEGDLPPGEHTIEGGGPRFAAPPQKITLERRGKSEVVLDAAPTRGRLRVTTNVPKSTISLDGAEVGKEIWEGELHTGPHTVGAAAAGYLKVEHILTLEMTPPLLDAIVLEPAVKPKTPDELAEEESALYRGVSFELGIFGAVGLHTPVDVTCPPASGATCNSSVPPLGGGARVRVGYNFGVIGLHFVGGLLLDKRTQTIAYPAPPTAGQLMPAEANFSHSESYELSSVGGFAGVGPSVTSKGQSVRVTLGVAGGVGYRNYSFARTLTNGLTDSTTASAGGISPMFLGEVGLLFGSTPGAKFELAVVGWLDAQSSTVGSPAERGRGVQTPSGSQIAVDVPSYSIITGPQVYIGPMIGIRFGR